MMDTTNSALLTVGIVGLGQWSQGKPIKFRFVIGATGLLFIAAVMGQVNGNIAQMFGILLLLTASFAYLPSIVKKTGLVK